MDFSSEEVIKFIKSSLAEDVGSGDHSSLAAIPLGTEGRARLICKEGGIVAGLQLAESIFKTVDPDLKVEVLIKDGEPIKYGEIVLYVEGNDRSILTAERLVLNCMQRMCGITTVTNEIVEKLKGTKCKVLDTRKTTPNFRLLEKWAVKIGGGINHRFGLFDMILIKDNHVDYAGGIKNALEAAQKYIIENSLNIPIEIEVRNLEELQQVLEVGGVVRIMLDNFDYEKTREAIKIIDGRFPVESSGGINPDTVRAYAECGVDYVSMGYLTHSAKSLDLSLKAMK